ncbi:peptidoglycan DD-metalloendopeptidase family protein [Nocardioides sp. LML1-1-1.1]|uniref:peptidoglycan DD-metalloendopeptidase family protein n=1 Tax=Nocardioides sp. LML1-1-1.1 TaxID=3135248 RepID=UPI003429FD20
MRSLLALMTFLLLAIAAPAAAAGPGAAGRDDPVGTWPLTPRPEVLARFDPPDVVWGAGHRGADLGGRPGQPVRTALPGQVTFTGRIAGRGVVVVGHGDTRTTYEPVTAVVHVGDVLAGGEVLGTLELVGSHCFPRACLHWGWLRGTTYLDPLLLVGGGPVRLLPLWRDRPGPGQPRQGRQVPGGPALTPAGVLAGTRAAVGRW